MSTLNWRSGFRFGFGFGFGFRSGHLLSIPIGSLALFLLVSIFAGQPAVAGGKLRRARTAVSKSSAPAKPTPTKNSKPAKSVSISPAKENREEKQREEQSDSKPERNGRLAGISHLVHGSRDESHYRDDSRSRHDSSGKHDSKRRNSNRPGPRSRRQASGVFFYSSPVLYNNPIVLPVVETCAFDSPQPVSFEAAPPINSPIQQPVYEPVVETMIIEPISAVVPETLVAKNWFQELTSSYWATLGSDFDGITSGGLGLKLQAPASLGLEASLVTLRESTDEFRDSLWIGDVNLMYEVLNHQDVRGRIGLGVNWLSDSIGTEAGLNLSAGVDLRLTNRLILSAEGDLGSLGDADFFHGRVNTAYRIDNLELMLGVDLYNISGVEVNSVFTGIQMRF